MTVITAAAVHSSTTAAGVQQQRCLKVVSCDCDSHDAYVYVWCSSGYPIRPTFSRPMQNIVGHILRARACTHIIGTAVFPILTCDTPGISSQQHPEGEPCMYKYKMTFFSGIIDFSLSTAGLFSCFLLRGTQWGRVYTTVQVLAPTGLRGTCSRCSKLRDPASN